MRKGALHSQVVKDMHVTTSSAVYARYAIARPTTPAPVPTADDNDSSVDAADEGWTDAALLPLVGLATEGELLG